MSENVLVPDGISAVVGWRAWNSTPEKSSDRYSFMYTSMFLPSFSTSPAPAPKAPAPPKIALHSTTRPDKWIPAEAMVASCGTNHFAGKHSEYDARTGVHSLKVVKGVKLIIPREFCPERISPPVKECKCGIYAANSIEEAQKYGDIIGRVALWGTVVVSETGWRAQYAYPQALFVPDENLADWRAQLAPYRVPVLKKSAIASMAEAVAV